MKKQQADTPARHSREPTSIASIMYFLFTNKQKRECFSVFVFIM
jgi:hypothetical protein